VNEQKVGMTAGGKFVACFSRTNPTTVVGLDQNLALYTSGKTVTGCSTGKKLTSGEFTAAKAAVASYRAQIAAAATRQLAAAAACKAAVSPVLAALNTLEGQTTGGVNSDEFSTDYGTAQGIANQQGSAMSATDAGCQPIVGNLQQALSAYNDASSAWIACMQDVTQASCVGTSQTGNKVQADWTAADTEISGAQSGLSGLMQGTTPPASTSGAGNGSTQS
jgi:hypothetical protein